MRQNKVIPFFIIAVLMVSSFAVSAAYAHSPTSVAVTTTETTATITWVHTASAGCATSDSGSGCLTDVDIVRTPGQTAAVNYTTTVSNSTQYVVANNATGLTTWTDHSLPEGTIFAYEVCHGDPDTHTCAVADTNETNAGGVDPVYTQTKAVAINATSINISMDQNSAVVSWLTPSRDNHTAVTGLKIEYSLDGGTNYTTATSNSTQEGTDVAYRVTGLQTAQQYIFRIAAVTESNGDTGITAKSASGAAGTTNTFTVTTRGQEVGKVAPPPQATSYSSGTITDGNLQVTVKENKGWDRILNVALYTNIREDQTKQYSDTYIIWNYFDPVQVSDPHGYFNNVNVVTAQSGVRTMDVTYEITWNKPLAKSDVILETSNFQSKVGTTIIKEAWKSFPVKQISYETPEETPKETIMTLFDGGIMNHLLLINNIDHALLSAVDYFVNDEIIDVSQDVVVLQQEEGVEQLFEMITLSQDNVKVGNKYLKTLVISGTLKDEFHQIGEPVTFYISSPDGTDSQITAVTTSARTFKVPIIIDEFESGIYQFQPSHKDLLGEPFSFKH
uniref:Putative Fibronectin type III domain protein n=1 Tax=uncultured marine crenarchaeote HF4000_APKG7F19 TaxID=455601 RepID=B3T9Q7_9ARCH|nr:putative Fibronectin type III domain protein [uncultured marine crenarchaeote HF4000_APKG7F19]